MYIRKIDGMNQTCLLAMETPAYDHVQSVMSAVPAREMSITPENRFSAARSALMSMTVHENGTVTGWVGIQAAADLMLLNALLTGYSRNQMRPGDWDSLLGEDRRTDALPDIQRPKTHVLRLSLVHLTTGTIRMLREKLEAAVPAMVRVVDSGFIDGILIPFGLDEILSEDTWPHDLKDCARAALDNGCTALEFGKACPVNGNLLRYDN